MFNVNQDLFIQIKKEKKNFKTILSISLKKYPPYISKTESVLKLCKIDIVSLCGSIPCHCVAQTSLNFVQIHPWLSSSLSANLQWVLKMHLIVVSWW